MDDPDDDLCERECCRVCGDEYHLCLCYADDDDCLDCGTCDACIDRSIAATGDLN